MKPEELHTFDEKELKDVAVQLLQSGSGVQLRLGGTSMFPFFRSGDVALIVQHPISTLRLGQTVVFKRDDRWIAHRLVDMKERIGGNVFISQGDSIVRRDAPFTEKDYLGIIRSVQRKGVKIELDQAWRSFYSRLIVITSPLPHYMIRLFLKIKKRSAALSATPF